MNILTATELKKRGVAAVQERLRAGPVYLTRRRRVTAVVVSVEEYLELSMDKPASKRTQLSAMQWLIRRRAVGSKSKRQLVRALREERNDWA